MRERNYWAYSFSKRVVVLIVALFFCHMFFADLVMLILGDLSALGQISDDITHVTEACLVGYVFKAALENVYKIKGGDPDNY